RRHGRGRGLCGSRRVGQVVVGRVEGQRLRADGCRGNRDRCARCAARLGVGSGDQAMRAARAAGGRRSRSPRGTDSSGWAHGRAGGAPVIRLICCLLVGTLVLSGCAGHDPLKANNQADGTLVIGSADFAESELLMNIYAEALRRTGVDVQTRPRIGAREFYVEAVRAGELAVMPEYTGNLLEHVAPRSR